MSTRLATMFAGCAVLAVAVAFAVGAPKEPGGATTADASPAGSGTASVARDVASPMPEPDATRHELVAPAGTDAVDTASNRRRLRIVDESGAPLPGAEYFEGSWPEASMTGLLVCEADRELWHPDAWLAHCDRQVADAGGYVDAHPTDVGWLYVARHGARIAFWGWPFPAELRFAPERTCKVTVVDSAGNPVAAAAVMVRGSGSAEALVGTTDAQGTCLVEHLECLENNRELQATAPRFGIRGLGLQQAEVPFDAASPPAAVTLTLPPCGPIAVELVDASGTRLSSPEPVVLLGPDGEELAEYTRPSGPIEFGLCACGAQVAVAAREGRTFAGPRAPGERVTMTLRLQDLQPGGYVLIGRALAADRTPLADCALQVMDRGWGRRVVGWSTTTGTGMFLFVFRPGDARDLRGSGGLGIVEEGTNGAGQRIDQRGAVLDLGERIVPGIVDVGDVVFSDAVVIARGRVRNAAGEPIVASITRGRTIDGAEIVEAPGGTFEVRALPDADWLTLHVTAPGHADHEVSTELPCADLDIVLAPSGHRNVLVAVEPELREHHESMCVELVDAAGARSRAAMAEDADGWLCRFAAAPGTYRCEVRPFQSTEPLVTVPGIVVAAGDEAGEPLRIDLRGRLRAMHLRWVDVAGADSSAGFFVHLAVAPQAFADGLVWDAMRTDRGCVLLGTGEPVSLVFESHAYRAAWSGPFGDAEVTVQPVPEIPFRIVDLLPAPQGDEWCIRAIARSGEGRISFRTRERCEMRPNAFTFGTIDAAGRGTIRLLPNTRYDIELLFSPGKLSTRRSRSLDAISGQVAVGAALPDELMFRFDAEEMAEVIR